MFWLKMKSSTTCFARPARAGAAVAQRLEGTWAGNLKTISMICCTLVQWNLFIRTPLGPAVLSLVERLSSLIQR